MVYRIITTGTAPDEAKRWGALIEALGTGTATESHAPVLILPPSDLGKAPLSLDALNGVATEHVVVLSSARAQGLSDRNPGFLDESIERATRDPEALAWRRYERSLTSAVSDGSLGAGAHMPRVTILRCCPVRSTPDAIATLFDRRVLLSWLGFDPPIQLLDLERLVAVLQHVATWPALDARAEAVQPERFYVGPDDAARLSRVCRTLGIVRVPVPGLLLRLAAGLTRRSSSARRFLRRPFSVSNRRILERTGMASLGNMLPVDPAQSSGASEDHAAVQGEEYGFDGPTLQRLSRWVLEPLRRWYWRVAASGLEHLPRSGPTLLVGVHRGMVPLDAVMLLHLVARATSRRLRTLVHPSVTRAPFLSWFFPAIGARLATKGNMERTLANGLPLAVYPEGVSVAMAPSRTTRSLQPFLSIEFARAAVEFSAPVVPVAAVGPAETLPVWKNYNWRWWKRFSGWPTLPVGFLFPFGPPIPLPAKWHIVFLDPIDPEELPGEDDEVRAQELARRVQQVLEREFERILQRRRSVWWGELAPVDGDEEGERS